MFYSNDTGLGCIRNDFLFQNIPVNSLLINIVLRIYLKIY